MKAVFLRELNALMHSMTGWIIAAAVPLVFTVMTALHLLSGSAADYIRVILDSTVVFGLIVPVYASQGFAKDRRTGADRLLHSLPVNAVQVVLGRYFAQCVPFLAGVAISGAYPAALSFFGEISALQVVFGMLLFMLCGMHLIALALYISRAGRNGYVNALLSLAVMAVCYYLPDIAVLFSAAGAAYWCALIALALAGVWLGWKATRSITAALVCGIIAEAAGLLGLNGGASAAGFWNGIASMVNVQSHCTSLYIGIMDFADIAYFLLSTAFLLMLSVYGWNMERLLKRRSAK